MMMSLAIGSSKGAIEVANYETRLQFLCQMALAKDCVINVTEWAKYSVFPSWQSPQRLFEKKVRVEKVAIINL